MKPNVSGIAIVCCALVAGVAVTSSSCSVSHKSGDFACVRNADCAHDRTCQDGFCVLAVTPTDAPAEKMDGSGGGQCPAICSSCNVGQKSCTIDCRSSNCTSTVTCPPGFHCTIDCNKDGSCSQGINCTQGLSCGIVCSGRQSCQNVQCGAGACQLSCTGTDSCQDVSCGNSCACDVTCTNPTSCAQNISCTSVACRSGLGCTSQPALCHSCM